MKIYQLMNRQVLSRQIGLKVLLVTLWFIIPGFLFGQSQKDQKKKRKGLLRTKVVVHLNGGTKVKGILKEITHEGIVLKVHPWSNKFSTLKISEIASIKAKKILVPRGPIMGAAVGVLAGFIVVWPPAGAGLAGAADAIIIMLTGTSGTISGALIESLASKRWRFQINGDEEMFQRAKTELLKLPNVENKIY